MSVLLSRLGLAAMTFAGPMLLFTANIAAAATPVISARLAIYYGYPSLVNGANGDVEKAANVFGAYDVVVFGDGLEFRDKQPARYPPGDPEEHQKVLKIISAAKNHSSWTRFYGYICLGEFPSRNGEKISLTPQEIEERTVLWKNMGVAGIFLDEAGYDFSVVTRERQNMAVKFIHDLGLRTFMNAYFPEHLFSSEDKVAYASGPGKNPQHLASLLDHRDLFLLESFQVKNGEYESVSAWRERLKLAIEFRRRCGTRVFVTTTTTEQQLFSAEKFNYAWWTARLYGLDGFGWGEPNFAAQSNALPDRRCTAGIAMLSAFEPSSAIGSDNKRFWRKAGKYLVVGDTTTHSVRRFPIDGSVQPNDVEAWLASARGGSLLTCGGGE